MFTAGALAGVYGVGTVPAHRRAGVGRAMMAHLARVAVADGAAHILLQTEAGPSVQRWYETGTDAGCAPCSFDDYLEELALFERWGLDSMTVLRSATIRAAECLGRATDFGSIDVNKWANLIVTEWDPTGDTSRLRQPLLVMYKGAAVVNALGERWP